LLYFNHMSKEAGFQGASRRGLELRGGGMADKKRPGSKRNGTAERSLRKTAPISRPKKTDKAGQQEQSQRLSEAVYQQIVDTMEDSLAVLDGDGTILFANSRAAHDLSGSAPAGVRGKNISQFVPKEQAESLIEKYRRVIVAGQSLEQEVMVTLQGADRWFMNTLRPISFTVNNIPAVVSSSQDITERRRAEKALRESERRFRGAFESAAVGASMVDLTGRFIKVNRFLCEMLGYSEGELLSKTFSDITHPDDVRIGLDYMKRQTAGELEFASFEKRYLRKDGNIVHLIISPALIRDDRGAPQYFVGLFQDITERKQAEDAVRKSENKFRTLFNSVNDSILILGLEGKFLEANEFICRRLEYSREELFRKSPKDIDTPEASKNVAANIRNTLEKGEHQFESEQMTKDGRRVPVEISARVIDFEGKRAILAVCRDTTERKRAEEALRASQKLLETIFEAVPT